MTLSTPPAAFPIPAPTGAAPDPGSAITGRYVLEVVAPAGPPGLAHWQLRAWPVARLGDLTLEARPLLPGLGPEHLCADLRAAGCLPLGPVRERR